MDGETRGGETRGGETQGGETRSGDRWQAVRRLRREAPRDRWLRWSVVALGLLALYAWRVGEFSPGAWLTEHRLANLERFLGELLPYPLQGRADWSWADWGVLAHWVVDLMAEKGATGALRTLALAVVSVVLAAVAGAALGLPAARTLATPEPWSSTPGRPGPLRRWGWRGVVGSSRFSLLFLRSIPEYVWAFLLIALFGPDPWALVLALALHNAGILGRLDAEVVENLPPARLAALRSLGAGRLQVALVGILPRVLPRWLLFFFYRWETCVREATVLGMLGVVSLGFWIQDARARNHYDEMVFLILLGAALVLVGDVVSAVAREAVRRSR